MRKKYKVEVVFVNKTETQWFLYVNNGIAWKVAESGRCESPDEAWATAYEAYNRTQEK